MSIKKEILIIDDNPINLQLMEVILSLEGYNIKTAKDAKEALDLLDNYQPALIMMDLQLPGMDGLELTRVLKNNPKFSDIVIIAVTAYAMPGDQKKSMDAGCDAYVAKPINPQTLPALIAK